MDWSRNAIDMKVLIPNFSQINGVRNLEMILVADIVLKMILALSNGMFWNNAIGTM